jgi:surfeit locus 1 family protein
VTVATPARRLVVAGAVSLLGVAILAALGTWQLQRKAWKEGLIATLEQRFAAAPLPLPPPEAWPALVSADMEFRRVRFTAAFLHEEEALVYAGSSALRRDAAGPGYWVFTPARLADHALVIVDRGFVPEGRQDPARRPQGRIQGPLEVVGVLRWPEHPAWFSPPPDVAHNLWFVRDPVAIAAVKGLGAVAPFYVEQESPQPPGGLPSPAKLKVNLPNNHAQYMMTWYGLAAALAAVFAAYAVGQWRAGSPASP